ncbi:hypothetical protein HWV62_21062 [Athelia sp. TMB]|nr:hypothetical protein HWV62_21062 [Athelia sp. TMB]
MNGRTPPVNPSKSPIISHTKNGHLKESEKNTTKETSPPATPSPSRPVPRPVVPSSLLGEPILYVAVSAGVDKAFSLEAEKPIVKKEMPRTVERASPMEAAFDDDPMGNDTDNGEITDPNFFDDPKPTPDVKDHAEYDSEDYWRRVEYGSVHESDVAFINDSAVVDGDADTSSDDARFAASAAEKQAKSAKGKSTQRVRSAVDHVAPSLDKGKAAAGVAEQSLSEGDDAEMNEHELKELAEAKRLSLVDQTSPRRIGSSSKGPQALRAELSDESTDGSAQPTLARCELGLLI